MSFTEDNLIMLSALQHFAFYERQCAFIHIEQIWEENRWTAEGRILHERVHEAGAWIETTVPGTEPPCLGNEGGIVYIDKSGFDS